MNDAEYAKSAACGSCLAVSGPKGKVTVRIVDRWVVYTDMGRGEYNYFIEQKGVGDQPDGVAIRITATDGQVVEDIIPTIDAGKVFPGAVQFK